MSEAAGQRTAGDVLNDIGSMLADLTDELDAMLHMDRDPAVASTSSSNSSTWKKRQVIPVILFLLLIQYWVNNCDTWTIIVKTTDAILVN